MKGAFPEKPKVRKRRAAMQLEMFPELPLAGPRQAQPIDLPEKPAAKTKPRKRGLGKYLY